MRDTCAIPDARGRLAGSRGLAKVLCEPAVHLTAAAGQLLEHMAAIEGTTRGPGRRRGPRACRAQLLVSGIELDRAYDAAQ